MRSRRLAIGLAVSGALLGPAAASAWSGGALTPSPSGGTEYRAPLGKPRQDRAKRPVASIFRVTPRTVQEGGAPPRLAIRIDQRGVKKVVARLVFWPLRGNGRVLRIDLGRVRTGQTLHPAWPADQGLAAGRYTVRLHAKGPGGGTLRRRASASGRAPLTVTAPPVVPVTTVVPVTAPTDPLVSATGVFPVQGPHSYGGDDARFGAGRTGHTHEGQDVIADEGTPVVAPLPGTVIARDYQAKSAGFYLVESAVDGRTFFFAHCQANTFAVEVGQTVEAGKQLCRVGHTGDASGPHLHFEIWLGGWRVTKDSQPVDPLAQLLAWDHM